MAIEWSVKQENLLEIIVSDQLVYTEFQNMQVQMGAVIREKGKCRVLVILNNFGGWDKSEGWADSSSTEQTDPYIEKFAIVGEEKWRDMVEVFTLKGLRPVPIEYFSKDKEQQARVWLDSPA